MTGSRERYLQWFEAIIAVLVIRTGAENLVIRVAAIKP